MKERDLKLARRSFLSKAGVGAAALGAAIGAGGSPVRAQSGSPDAARWQPARHATDDWFDQVPGKHRFFFDTISPASLGQAIFFANNYTTANRTGYGLEPSELAIVICVRHHSTGFAFTDAMWAKYGKPLADRINFTDPKTSTAPIVNVFQASGYGAALTNSGVTLDSFIKRGGHLAVCQLSMRANSRAIASQTGGKAEEIYEELAAHLVPNSHIVPAGIVAVNRAQERGYSFSYTG